MPPWDLAHRHELHELVAPETQLLEMYRAQVHHQSEEPAAEVEYVIGEVNAAGNQLSRVKMEFVENWGAEYAETLLRQFRVLAFLAAFRVHDMIVSWTLLANGFPHNQLFKFAQKKQHWNGLVAATTLNVPPELSRSAVQQAFWGIYVTFEPARGAMTHEGKVQVQANGTIEVTDRRGSVHLIDDATQAAYLRLISMLIAELVGLDAPNEHRERLREHDLGSLQHLHNVSGFSTRGLVFDHVTIRVPIKEALSLKPFAAEIDFAKFDALTRSARPDPASVVYSLDVVAEMSDRTLLWRFAPGSAPQGKLALSETDPRFLAALSITDA